MSSGLELERSNLARIALAAWVNVDPDKLPADKMWIEHPNDANRQAWDRVVAAVLGARPPSSAPLLEALEELEGAATYLEALSDNHLRNDVDMLLDDCEDPRAVAERLRAALAAAKVQEKTDG